jgi:hypothetical protein
LRRADVRVRWSTPYYSRADAVLREVTQLVTVCTGYLPRTDPESAWRQNRLFSWVSFDASSLSKLDGLEPDKSTVREIKSVGKQWWYRSANARASHTYATGEDVFRLTHTDESGRCIDCGGHRQRPKCTCPAPERRIVDAYQRSRVP